MVREVACVAQSHDGNTRARALLEAEDAAALLLVEPHHHADEPVECRAREAVHLDALVQREGVADRARPLKRRGGAGVELGACA